MSLLADPVWALAFAAGLLFAGFCAGVIAGLLGVGGGIVVVPVLFHIFSALGIDPTIKMHLAVGTSLATIIPTAITSARAHHSHGAVDMDLLRRWAPAMALGVIAGIAVAGLVKGPVLTKVFAVVALLVAGNMAFRRDGSPFAEHLPALPFQYGLAALIGGFSAVMGIGGGTLAVPILTAFATPIRRAVGTAAALGLIIAVPGSIGFVFAGWNHAALPPASLGYVNLIGVGLITPATMLTAPFGVRLAHRISTAGLRKAFAAFLFLTSIRMLMG
jgi:uncharacterized membrane protein YfcA